VSAKAAERSKQLPARFAELQRFEEWIQWEDEARVQKHVGADVEELAAFYDAMLARAGEIWDYLAEVRLADGLRAEDEALLVLAITFAEISDGVEYYSPDSTAAVDMPRFKALHDSVFGWQRR